MIQLPKVNQKRKKRLGRGMGSGKGSHTSSHGQKGQKSRGKIHVLFEGMKMKKSLLKRLPLMRGKGKFHSRKKKVYNFKSAKPATKALAVVKKVVKKPVKASK